MVGVELVVNGEVVGVEDGELVEIGLVEGDCVMGDDEGEIDGELEIGELEGMSDGDAVGAEADGAPDG